MPRKTIVQVLMDRDGLTKEEAVKEVQDCKEELFDRLESGGDPSDICEEWFGLEPDYLMELM